MPLNNQVARTGDCECCDKTEVIVVTINGMSMCDTCKEAQERATKIAQTAQILDNSRKQDASITRRQDFHNAATVAFVELQGAINADPSLATQEEKDYKLTQEVLTRVKQFEQAIFEARETLLKLENERSAWQINGQQVAGRLRAELRAKFAELDVNYKPTPITKKEKTTKPVKSTSTGTRKAVNRPIELSVLKVAADAHNLPIVALRTYSVSHPEMTLEQVVKAVQELF